MVNTNTERERELHEIHWPCPLCSNTIPTLGGLRNICYTGWYLFFSREMFPEMEPAVPICRWMLLIVWKHDKSRLQARTLLWLMSKASRLHRFYCIQCCWGFLCWQQCGAEQDSSPAPAVLRGVQVKRFTPGLDAKMGLTFDP